MTFEFPPYQIPATAGRLEFGPAMCQHCGWSHQGRCPRIKAIEYHENGAVKRVEYHGPADPVRTMHVEDGVIHYNIID